MNDEQALALIKREGEIAMKDGLTTDVRMDDGRAARYVRDASGEITKDADGKKMKVAVADEQIETETLSGVAAMKQMWVDRTENGRDDNVKKMAARQLTATSSWPEIQGSFTKSGKRVVDTAIWEPAITTSLEDYPKVLRSRVIDTPHIVNGAKAAGVKAGYAENDDSIEARDFRSAHRTLYSIKNQMSNEDFSTQSDGTWEEMARIMQSDHVSADQKKQIREALKARFAAIQQAGGTTPQIMLGHLSTGGALQRNVDTILGDESVVDYLGDRRGPTP
jgi:hypothetical protein